MGITAGQSLPTTKPSERHSAVKHVYTSIAETKQLLAINKKCFAHNSYVVSTARCGGSASPHSVYIASLTLLHNHRGNSKCTVTFGVSSMFTLITVTSTL